MAMLASSGASASPATGGPSTTTRSYCSAAIVSRESMRGPARSSAGFGGSGPEAMNVRPCHIRRLENVRWQGRSGQAIGQAGRDCRGSWVSWSDGFPQVRVDKQDVHAEVGEIARQRPSRGRLALARP